MCPNFVEKTFMNSHKTFKFTSLISSCYTLWVCVVLYVTAVKWVWLEDIKMFLMLKRLFQWFTWVVCAQTFYFKITKYALLTQVFHITWQIFLLLIHDSFKLLTIFLNCWHTWFKVLAVKDQSVLCWHLGHVASCGELNHALKYLAVHNSVEQGPQLVFK